MKNHLSKIYFRIRKWRDKYFDGAAGWCISLKITANNITLFRILLAFTLFWGISVSYWLVLVVLVVDYLLDGLDGVIARKMKTSSTVGRILDLTTDDFFAVPLVFGIIWYNLGSAFWASLYLFMMTVDFFLNHIRFSFEVGKFPYSFSKYFLYLAILIMALGGLNVIDIVFVFWSVALFALNVHASLDLYKKYA